MRLCDMTCRWKTLLRFIATGVVVVALMGTWAPAASPRRIETMTYGELERIITRGNGAFLIFFTAAWCGHCKAMLPDLNRLYQQYAPRGVRFIGISVDPGNARAMEAVLKTHRADFPMFWVGEKAVDELQLIGLPMTLLVKDGRIVEKIPGTCSYVDLETKLREHLQ